MKVPVFIFSAVLILTLPAVAFGQTLADIFETTWAGGSKTRTETMGERYRYVYEKLYDIAYDGSDNSFTGFLESTILLNGTVYVRKAGVRGTFDPTDNSVAITITDTVEADPLPGNTGWDSGLIRLTIFADSDHDGYYILAGTTERQSQPDEFFELGTWPRY